MKVYEMHRLQNANVVEQFFGVYLLYCLNPMHKGKTYIGCTNDPNKRITQHNNGQRAGGARRTNNQGPWEMVLIVHGFHNSVAAFRFEWAWQNPHASHTLRAIARKSSKETRYEYAFRILSKMLSTAPWYKLPLTIRWLNENYVCEFRADCCPPMHMPIVHGPVVAKKLVQGEGPSQCNANKPDTAKCFLCHREINEKQKVECLRPTCSCICHIICLARHFTGDNETLIPVEGSCPSCDAQVLWGDIVRKKVGCVIDLTAEESRSVNSLFEKSELWIN